MVKVGKWVFSPISSIKIMFRHVASRVSLAGIRYKSLIATTSGPLPSWATCDPYTMGPDAPAIAQNLGNGVVCFSSFILLVGGKKKQKLTVL